MERQIKKAPQQIDASQMGELVKQGVARALDARSKATELSPEQVQDVSGGALTPAAILKAIIAGGYINPVFNQQVNQLQQQQVMY
jgi:hypothetical protein